MTFLTYPPKWFAIAASNPRCRGGREAFGIHVAKYRAAVHDFHAAMLPGRWSHLFQGVSHGV
jgi:hypothetical protein